MLVSTVLFGFVLRVVATNLWPHGTHGELQSGGVLGNVLRHWVVLPTNPDTVGN